MTDLLFYINVCINGLDMFPRIEFKFWMLVAVSCSYGKCSIWYCLEYCSLSWPLSDRSKDLILPYELKFYFVEIFSGFKSSLVRRCLRCMYACNVRSCFVTLILFTKMKIHTEAQTYRYKRVCLSICVWIYMYVCLLSIESDMQGHYSIIYA